MASFMPEVQTAYPRDIVEIEDQPIIMPDGCRLSARIWMPKDAASDPVPVILEHLPYRKRDGTIVRDSLTHPWMAGQGYACIRVDMRGNGDSDGLMEDEYTPQELQDACDVIAWATSQPWCSGTAGMMGISWGGFNSLQVAALRPPALKAIITICSTVDRFADDIHFKGGCLLGENFGWAANMLSYSSRPPDPLIAGDRWRDMWLDRLEAMPFLAREWISRQTRDNYWKHGSVCENFGAIEAAVLSIGGWHDGYRNTISHLVENLDAPVKGIVGPWIHKYPHYAGPEPRIGFLQEARRWWDRWLKGIDNGAEDLPAYRAWLMDSVAPARWMDARPGRWIAEARWPSRAIIEKTLELGDGALGHVPMTRPVPVNSPTDCGSQAGEYFPFAYGPELPDEQSPDDARSACFDGDVLDAPLDIVGAPRLVIRARSDKPMAQVAVRLCDLRPDGTSALISMGVLNLTHRRSSEAPELIVPGEVLEATVTLDQIAYRIPAGHRLRIAVSTACWPFIWPSPERATVKLESGRLDLPCRTVHANNDECSFERPVGATPWRHETLRPSASTREMETDAATGVVTTVIFNDAGENRDLEHGLILGSTTRERWSIHPDDPLSATAQIRWEQTGGREGWRTETVAEMEMRCDREWFFVTGRLVATEDGATVFERDWDKKIPRRFV
ncbi:MAG: CocE/NonD family hydrolase [Hoeflea sp.]|uniref:CocE/NonD family hydrolase n=1 Tax=Hoeflea sp. TaxID=1940281 RepID=UPI001DE2B064|nr:CocE/NonD family hydrolase [Hoeflea sp.]MBU4528750.1 CocE/NonD family hydrolase [Alphaproteobacteria bacterium]MBU4545923.1 CocE/NonD family hydrolase [Alphaproteobacteria bacterium]MBU4549884.1 CocE/NonD family hydrolase [Alphaproteobacteria bacterium]MBV1725881.1 CocE/NonD family hydrolase [Hoeflea sp.]MBV1762606.1 CocE/NonD family hydrolase [Hoeflea sp.]